MSSTTALWCAAWGPHILLESHLRDPGRPEYKAVAAKVRTQRLIAVAVVAVLAAAGWAAGVLPIEQWVAAVSS